MPEQQFDLETLYRLLELISKDGGGDCSRIIDNLIKSLVESTLNESSKVQNKKNFSSIKILLNLFEKLTTNTHKIKSEFPVSVVVQSIKNLLLCGEQNCSFPGNEIQCDILSIVSLLYKNVYFHNSQENVEKLVELYFYILSCLDTVTKDCKSGCLIFKLKILNSIYHVLSSESCSQNVFIEKLKFIRNLDECRIFADLVLHDIDEVAIQTLVHVVPGYISCFRSHKVIEIIWKQISDFLTRDRDNLNYFKVLIVLCILFEVCFVKAEKKDEVHLTGLFVEDVNYWEMVQFALVEKDPAVRKQGMYLFKKTLEVLISTNQYVDCMKEDIIFYWHLHCKDELYKIYSEIIISLEFLEEQQVHIIKPFFPMIERLGTNIIESHKVNFSWILLLHKKALMHESTQVVLWGLSNFLKLPENFFSQEHIAKETVYLLVNTLSNMSIYYNKDLSISKELNDFFKKISKLNNSKSFFSLFIKQICSHVWSAEALFFVIHSFSGIENFLPWGEEEISKIGIFVSKGFKTYNKIIRSGIQCEILNAVTALTDHNQVGFEKIILLISKFYMKEIIHRKNQGWNNFTNWLWKSYPSQVAENALKGYYKNKGSGEEFNEKLLSLTLILFDYRLYSDEHKSFAVNYLCDMFSSFREIGRRPYCNKSLLDEYLTVIASVYEANMNDPITGLIRPTLPYARDIILYIHTQLQQISSLNDFSSCQSYLCYFKILIKTLLSFDIDIEFVNDFYVKLITDCEACVGVTSSVSSVGVYWRFKLLCSFMEFDFFELKPRFLYYYLLNNVNETLEKKNDDSKQTRDLQTLWGRMNSEFLEGKWKILRFLIEKKLLKHDPLRSEGALWIENNALVKLCTDSLNTGGYGVLPPVTCILKSLLPALENPSELRRVVDSVWKLLMERRKTEEFKLYLSHFVEMLYQELFITKGEFAVKILLEYVDIIFSDSSYSVVNILMQHIQQMNLLQYSMPLFCHVVTKALIFGPVKRKDERLTNQVCHYVETLNICQPKMMGELITSNEIRARAVEMILRLDKNSETHRNAAKNLIQSLLKLEKEINKNRIRYFGNSHVHRVKNRLMQALLLLEPVLSPNESEAKELSSWLYSCLLRENSQTSVRYQQEWLLVRMLHRHSDLMSLHGLINYNNNSVESNKRGLCSVMAVSFHLCQLISGDLLEKTVAAEIDQIFSLCFHQHFEVRLYSQVFFHKLFIFAENKKLTNIIEKYEYINMRLRDVFERSLKGNFGKNLEKLLDDFYFTKFNPLEHYSLETIYLDLPMLTNVDSDEWITLDVFERCGVVLKKIDVPFQNLHPIIEYFTKETKFNSVAETAFNESKSENILRNYQKKIIPKKPLIPGWEESSVGGDVILKKGGLIVVASLIDRIPNLGGLARTCEIFGASEYIVNSLRYTEDKQFTSLSVTAEKWITVKEVKIQNLLDYITEMKLDGYTVIGAEQTLHSIPLGSAKFPKKSLLLLGNEKEGIPPNLLPLLDVCVEIPQIGIIRSLNVHVTGALFIWEYAKQNYFS